MLQHEAANHPGSNPIHFARPFFQRQRNASIIVGVKPMLEYLSTIASARLAFRDS